MKRVLTTLVLVPVVTYAVVWAPRWLFLTVLAAIAVMCFREFVNLAAAHRLRVPLPVGLAAGGVVLLAPRTDALFFALLAMIALALILSRDDLAAGLPEAGALLLGVAYVFGCWRAAAALREIHPYWLLFGLAINWVGDISAFYAGRALGRHKLASRVSPNKSWEGSAASLAASVVFGAVFVSRLLPEIAPWAGAALAAAGNVAGQFGDLCESAIKRGAGMKDSGSLLPGHGGWLDRVDSTLFSLPVLLMILSRPWEA